MTQPRWTISPSVIRADAENPRAVEGIAIPYNEIWESPNGYREMFAPGAFAAEADRWMARQDGARLPFLRSHTGREFLGGVAELRDTPEGLWFRAELRDTQAAAEYLEEVAAGANGASVEFAPVRFNPRGGADRKTTIHAQSRLGAIAGALTPAYDSARVAARSGDTDMATREQPGIDEPTEPQPEPTEPTEPQPVMPSEPTKDERRDAERKALAVSAGAPAYVTRAERIYTPTSEHSFLRDFIAANRGDSGALERQERHYAQLDEIGRLMARAGEALSTEIPGAYPTETMPGLFTARILKGRPLASFFSRVAITDARPRTYAKVTTSTTVAAQSAEGANPPASDFATTAETVTPLLYGGEILVSRQVLDGADPAAEAMIMEDLMEAYAQRSEQVVAAAVEATGIAGAAITAATPHDGVVDAIIGYQTERFQPAEAVFLPTAAYSALLKETGTDGRLLVPWLGPSNAAGSQDAAGAGASVLGVRVEHGWSLSATAGITGRRTDMVIFESAVARFSYEQVAGPANIKLGVWAYLAANDRRGVLESAIA